MSGDVHSPTSAGPPSPDPPAPPYGTSAGAAGVDAAPGEKPEAMVGAAFAGGLLLAMILKRFSRDD